MNYYVRNFKTNRNESKVPQIVPFKMQLGCGIDSFYRICGSKFNLN